MAGNSMPGQYFSFLLRMWQTGLKENETWRVMLEDPHTREVLGFDSLDAFFCHLQNLAAEELADPNNPDQFAGNQ